MKTTKSIRKKFKLEKSEIIKLTKKEIIKPNNANLER